MRSFWNHRYLSFIDFRILVVLFFLMGISLLVISSMTMEADDVLLSATAKSQLKWFAMGWVIFFLTAGLDYRKLREWTWPLYVFLLVLLLGLYIVPSIQNVHRWYRIPFLHMSFQPSEHAKLIVVLTLGWFMEKKSHAIESLNTFFQILLIAGVPFLLILKQPDLGTASVLYPIALVMCYFGGVHKKGFRILASIGLIAVIFSSLLFLGILSHEKMKPFFTTFLKEYQYARLNPHTYHQEASKTAVAIGGITGSGFHQSSFSSRKWLPAAHTDSVFAAFGEEFGLIGITALLFLFYALIYFGFQVTVHAKDHYGRLLSAGLTIYLAMHIIMNIAMMLGFLPMSGVPLVLITYGGSSVLTTMAAIGILQSIYSRRFMF